MVLSVASTGCGLPLGGLGGLGGGIGTGNGLGSGLGAGLGGGPGRGPGGIAGGGQGGLPPLGGQAPAGPAAPGSSTSLAGGGSAVPPVVGGPGSADLAPPGQLAADDYDYRPDLRSVQVPQAGNWQPPSDAANDPYVIDVMTHDANPDMQTSNIGTWVHETTHGIHSNIRNSNGGRVEGLYFENGVGAIFADPGTPVDQVRGILPAACSSFSRYSLYLVQSSGDWPNASHLYDEWGAYINGGRAAVQIANAGKWREGQTDEVDGMMEFLYFCTGATSLMQPQSGDASSATAKALKGAYACCGERTAKWLGMGLQVPEFTGFSGAQEFAHFQSSPDNQQLRAFLVQWIGKGWTKRVFGFEQ